MRYTKALRHLLLYYAALTTYYLGRYFRHKSWELDQRLRISKGEFELVEKD